MVFSEKEAVPRDTGHKGDTTGDTLDVIRSVTGADSEGDDTGVIQGDIEVGT